MPATRRILLPTLAAVVVILAPVLGRGPARVPAPG